MTIDLNRANVLLDVVHKIAAAGPGLSSLTALASAELSAMNDEAAPKIAKDKEEVSKKSRCWGCYKGKGCRQGRRRRRRRSSYEAYP